MEKNIRAGLCNRNKFIQGIVNIFPKNLRLRLNPDRRVIENFILQESKKIKPKSKVLDAGAGPAPYENFFNHCFYESTDFVNRYGNIDFISSLDKIPKPNSTYDFIICTEVLEHVKSPQKVLDEFARVLKKGGKVFLTVPQGRALHQEPYNFFYFTKYGLKLLLENSGFKKIKIKPKGGFFNFLADAIRFNDLLKPLENKPILYWSLSIIGYPFTQILIPLIFSFLDPIDRTKKWTTGYLAEAEII